MLWVLSVDILDLEVAAYAYTNRCTIESDLDETEHYGNGHATTLSEHDELSESVGRAWVEEQEDGPEDPAGDLADSVNP